MAYIFHLPDRVTVRIVAIALLVAIGFLGLLAYDIIRRRRRARRHQRNEPETWREKLLKPVQNARMLRNDLKQILRERARRERRRKRRPPALPR